MKIKANKRKSLSNSVIEYIAEIKLPKYNVIIVFAFFFD